MTLALSVLTRDPLSRCLNGLMGPAVALRPTYYLSVTRLLIRLSWVGCILGFPRRPLTVGSDLGYGSYSGTAASPSVTVKSPSPAGGL